MDSIKISKKKKKTNQVNITSNKNKVGLLCGRFQPFHYGHFDFISGAFEHVDHLIIGITNPDIHSMNYAESDLQRSRPESNIFTYKERKEMIDEVISNHFSTLKTHEVIKFNLNDIHSIVNSLPPNLLFFHTIYDSWGEEKRKLFESTGTTVKVLWHRKDKITTATNVRYHIAERDQDWQRFVPRPVVKIIERIGIDELKKRTHMPTNGKKKIVNPVNSSCSDPVKDGDLFDKKLIATHENSQCSHIFLT